MTAGTRRRRWLLLSAVLACSAKPPREASPPAPAAAGGVAGSASCRTCHERFYGLWSTSFHGLAMQPWGPRVAEAVRPTAEPLRIGDRTYAIEVSATAGAMVERGPDGARRHPIAHALGGKDVLYFLTLLDRGFLQTLPVAWDVRRREWFDTAASGVRHAPGFPAEPLRWRDREYTFNSSCHACHVSQLSTSHDPAADAYRTTWAEPGINCETCHGPGAEHARAFSAAPRGELRAPGLIAWKSMTHQQRNDACAPCHARTVPLTQTFRPGDRYADHFDLEALESPDFHPDGRELGEAYTLTSWRLSPCARGGALDCVTCHTSSGRYRFREAARANDACLPCHADQAARGSAHTHHPAGSEASRCAACHMPQTEFARMRRTDHSMRPPAPAATLAFGSPNACNLCHRDRGARWADATVRRWYPKDRQRAIVEQGRLVEAARKADWSRVPAMLAYLRRPEREEIVAVSLARLLRDCPDPRAAPALVEVLGADRSPLVRGAAAETLGLLPGVARRTGALAAATRDDFRLVRVRAARALAAVPRDRIDPALRDAVERATVELEDALRVRADDPWMLTELGAFRMDRGDLDGAAASLRAAVRIRPEHVPGWVNLSIVLAARGDRAAAEASLRRALATEPANAPANLNLGLLLAEERRVAEAEAALRAAIAADPGLAVAEYNLCGLLLDEQPGEAALHCARASALRPDDPRYASARAFAVRKARAADALTAPRPAR